MLGRWCAGHAGINAMDAIAKSLRAWTLPFSVPIARSGLYEEGQSGVISPEYKKKLDLLIKIAIKIIAV